MATWEYALPNGLYFVTAGSGDPDYWQGPNRITVEGRVAVGDPVLQAGQFVEGEVLVEVRDGRLTVEIGAIGNPTNSTNTDTAFNYLVIRRAVRRR